MTSLSVDRDQGVILIASRAYGDAASSAAVDDDEIIYISPVFADSHHVMQVSNVSFLSPHSVTTMYLFYGS